MPAFRFPVFKFLVKTKGKVINFPPSPGQHFMMGIFERDGSVSKTTSWHGAYLTVFGGNFDIVINMWGMNLILSIKVDGISGFTRLSISRAISSTCLTLSTIAMRS